LLALAGIGAVASIALSPTAISATTASHVSIKKLIITRPQNNGLVNTILSKNGLTIKFAAASANRFSQEKSSQALW